jgi:hypothetical protein
MTTPAAKNGRCSVRNSESRKSLFGHAMRWPRGVHGQQLISSVRWKRTSSSCRGPPGAALDVAVDPRQHQGGAETWSNRDCVAWVENATASRLARRRSGPSRFGWPKPRRVLEPNGVRCAATVRPMRVTELPESMGRGAGMIWYPDRYPRV